MATSSMPESERNAATQASAETRHHHKMASGLKLRQRRGQPRVSKPRDRRCQPPPHGNHGSGGASH
ncbi:Heparan-Sulfate 6-O-Sulfotransferase 2 [Manis pentadactyla]|nr:Heparan-Sulfate 6-O-Sulfotransferase 2 [Manis pentadactyla]